jgi:hypothetical protein
MRMANTMIAAINGPGRTVGGGEEGGMPACKKNDKHTDMYRHTKFASVVPPIGIQYNVHRKYTESYMTIVIVIL